MHRPNTLALCLAAALSTTCAPAAHLTTATERSSAPDRSGERRPPTPECGGTIERADEARGLADSTTPVILVVLDGVRWQEIFGGIDSRLAATHHSGPVVGARSLLPSLYAALDARGAAVGAPGYGVIAASGPNFVSLPGYTEIFGGHPPAECQDNDCAGASGPTIVRSLRGLLSRRRSVSGPVR